MTVAANFKHLAPWLCLAMATSAWANMGIPMLMIAWPAYVLGLIPVVAIEAFIGTRDLRLSWGEVTPVSLIGNLWSTFIGVPVVWGILFAVEMAIGMTLGEHLPTGGAWNYVLFPFFIAWLGPTENVWAVYAAFVLLAIPFCFASIWIESKVAIKKLPHQSPEAVRAWIRRANIWSYVLLVACAIAFPVLGK